ncbi:MAG TPA: NAD(P)/FAD-dependent oxidoreductase [Fimbriimonas sp.]|nr:NAD(P)/FAD-dependent oxidoreductase [Fimbriimonas sp.]
MSIDCDVAIIGGGPAGTTAGTLLVKYNPKLKVLIVERETFPRDHIGESQLPLIAKVLYEMGAWEKVEAAGFPIKVGGTYRWGRKNELWDIDFLPNGKLDPAPRPGTFTGQRQSTAFQVDRAIYDKILLDHAKEMGCAVLESTAVREIARSGDHVEGLVLSDGQQVKARYYVDASGHSGILRRAMGVQVDYPTNLQNIAIWNYWRNAEWATTIGVGGTRIQVLSLEIGWLWFIPLGPNRTSIGLVIPVSYYKEQGKRPGELYDLALQSDKIVSTLTRNATVEGPVKTTNDWSFVSDRLTGDNWFLAGECAGFADPILSAGMSLAHSGARDVSYTILALDKGEYQADWLKSQYSDNHRAHIRQHIRFADYWYTAHGAFPDLQGHAQDIARDAGLDLTPEEAWTWIGQGGFIDSSGSTDIGFFGSLATKELISTFSGQDAFYAIEGKTHFRLDLEGAEKDWVAEMANGVITRYRAYRRHNKTLPLVKAIGWLVRTLKAEKTYTEINNAIKLHASQSSMTQEQYHFFRSQVIKALEVLVTYGWIVARSEEGAEPCPKFQGDLAQVIHTNRDVSSLLTEPH